MQTKMSIILLVLTTSVEVPAQLSPATQPYWVVETNENDQTFSIVKLYDSRHTLLHEIKFEKYIDFSSRQHRKFLNKVLNDFVRSLSGKTTVQKKIKSTNETDSGDDD